MILGLLPLPLQQISTSSSIATFWFLQPTTASLIRWAPRNDTTMNVSDSCNSKTLKVAIGHRRHRKPFGDQKTDFFSAEFLSFTDSIQSINLFHSHRQPLGCVAFHLEECFPSSSEIVDISWPNEESECNIGCGLCAPYGNDIRRMMTREVLQAWTFNIE